MQKWIGDPRESDIYIYRNPRRVFFKRHKSEKRFVFVSDLIFAFGASVPLWIPIIFLYLFDLVSSSFIIYFYFTVVIQLGIFSFLSHKYKFFSEIFPTFVWIVTLSFLQKKKTIILRQYYNTKLTLQLPPFMFINYTLSGDWKNYKSITIKQILDFWVFEIILNNIVEKGQLTIKTK